MTGSSPKVSAAKHPAEVELVITRLFDAPRDLVFKCWTEPKQLARWWGPSGFTLPVCEMDLRPGGAYRFCMRSPEGRDYWVEGIYHEIIEPERIVFSAVLQDEPGREVRTTVTFAEQEGRTQLRLHQTFVDSVLTRGTLQGWNESLDRLAELIETESMEQSS